MTVLDEVLVSGVRARNRMPCERRPSRRGQSGGYGWLSRARLAGWSGAIDSRRVGSPGGASRLQRLRYGRDRPERRSLSHVCLEDLMRAAALIVAEVERLDRASAVRKAEA
jgi:hypothetical protein